MRFIFFELTFEKSRFFINPLNNIPRTQTVKTSESVSKQIISTTDLILNIISWIKYKVRREKNTIVKFHFS